VFILWSDEVTGDREIYTNAGMMVFEFHDDDTIKYVRPYTPLGRSRSSVSLNASLSTDAHSGPVEAIGATLPGASWQRCRTHYKDHAVRPQTPRSRT